MTRYLHGVVMGLSLVILPTLLPNSAQAGDADKKSWDPKAAAKYLDERADWWLQWSGAARGQGTACISCHTAMPVALARPALTKQLGLTAVGQVQQRLIENVKKRVENWDKIVAASNSDEESFRTYYSGQRKSSSLGTESILNALILVNHDARQAKGNLSATTKKALAHLWEQQKENGAWLWLEFGLSPWEKDGEYYGACLAATALEMAGKDYSARAEVQPKVAALVKYLKSEFPSQPLHNRAACLWVSSRLPGILSEADTKKLIEEFQNAQEPDGGWSLPKLGKHGQWTSQSVYPEGAVSDGYATGLVVLALKRAGLTADNAQLQRGIAWLETNQKDGTWPVNYLNKKRDPNTDTGKFMRDAATSFAILALTEPSEPAHRGQQKP